MLVKASPLLAQTTSLLVLDGFSQWLSGHDEQTQQLQPMQGRQALVRKRGRVEAYVKFKVKSYGELSFPIDPRTPWGEEARKVDLSQSRWVRIRYRANVPVVVQLRQTGTHGGVHPHSTLPACSRYRTCTLYFSAFTGGETPLDLTNVAKFNLALLTNAPSDPYAELSVRSFEIDRYTP
ncbi:hypothetical protein BWI93_13925 [Siphonobacter sp. BAB-5385]|nr:hypothetical protein BWI93_13925 [Siphonobacter sp. BAB-5385]